MQHSRVLSLVSNWRDLAEHVDDAQRSLQVEVLEGRQVLVGASDEGVSKYLVEARVERRRTFISRPTFSFVSGATISRSFVSCCEP